MCCNVSVFDDCKWYMGSGNVSGLDDECKRYMGSEDVSGPDDDCKRGKACRTDDDFGDEKSSVLTLGDNSCNTNPPRSSLICK